MDFAEGMGVAARRRQNFSSLTKSSIRLGASAVLCTALLVSSQPALATFTQQGPKLVGAGAVGNADQGRSVALSADGNTAIVGTEHRMELDREFKLRNGEAAHVGNEGLALRFERVTTDGRCPVGDPCVSDVGDAVVLVTVQQQPHEPVARELHTHPSSTPAGQYLRYRVRLVRLEPRPIGEQHVSLSQYWATFMVSR